MPGATCRAPTAQMCAALLDRVVIIGVARIDGLAPREAFVLPMIKADAVLAEPPAEIDFLIVNA